MPISPICYDTKYGFKSNEYCSMVLNPSGEVAGYHDELAQQSVVATSSQEAEDTIEQIRSLAQEIAIEFPSQYLRQMRPLFANLNAPKAIPEGLEQLYAKKQEITSLIEKLKLPHQSLSSPKVENDLALIINAKSLLEIVLHFSSKAPKDVAIISPDNFPPYITKVVPNTTALAMFEKIDTSPKIASAPQSTSKAEAEIKKEGFAEKLVTSLYTGKPPVPGQRPFEFYIDVYNVNRGLALPGFEKLKSVLEQFLGTVENPYRVWIADFSATAVDPSVMTLYPALGDRYIDLTKHLPIFQFIKTYEQAYKNSALLLHSSHPDISYETLVSFLMVNTFVEIFWMQNEDPWQDRGAASAFQSNMAGSYNKYYKKYTEEKGFVFGVKIGDSVYDIPWQAASVKVPVASQGIGPNAVIIGDLLKAAAYDNASLWNKYFPDTARTEAEAVRIALDPLRSVKAVALVYDVKLRELNQTIFSDPQVKMPDDVYPSIKDPKKSREYFKLSWVRYCKAFPEAAVNFPDYFPYSHYSWNIDFIGSYFKLIETIMDQPDSWPGLKAEFIPSIDKHIADYFEGLKNPKNYDALMLMLLPK